MPATKEDLFKLLLLTVTELHIVINHTEPGPFRRDAEQRMEYLVAAIWAFNE